MRDTAAQTSETVRAAGSTLCVLMSAGSVQRRLSNDDAPRSVARAARELASRLVAYAAAESAPPRGSFVRLETPVEPGDLLSWLRGVRGGSRRYFRDRSAKFELACVGVAASEQFGAHSAWHERSPQADTSAAAAWFVALPFDAARARDAAWLPFAESSCVLPEIELRREGERHLLAVHWTAAHEARAVAERLEQLCDAPEICFVEPALVREADGGGEAEWTRAVRGALAHIAEGSMRKIVLARTRRYSASAPIDPVALLSRLAARESRGFRFLVEAAPGCAFLGVTPERLVSRSGRVARSEAVAGTRPRGVDGVADRLLGESLLASAKDRREHELVVERVRDALSAHASSLRIDAEPRLLRLAYVQHLATRVHAELRPNTSDAELVRALHPTPAVAGAPVERAIEALRTFEPFDRGLYAGPVGVVSREGAELAVAIRSARVEGDSLTAFAGAGIVEGSDPAEEWRETGHKLLAFERLAT